jgi:hypothetical protein
MTPPSDPPHDSPANFDDALLQRVRKLFDKANATTNQHEAEAFSRKAAELVARHRIDPERLASRRSGGAIAMRELPLGRGAYVRARLSLLTTIGDHHDVRVVFRSLPTGMVAYMAGHEPDLDVVEMLYHSLHQQAGVQMAAISRGTPAATQKYRRSFLLGFASRLGDVLDEMGRVVDEERTDEQVAATAIALRERGVRVDEFLEQSFGRIRSARPAGAAHAHGWRAGADAATRADVGRRPISTRPALGP